MIKIAVSETVPQEGCQSFSNESGRFRIWPEPLQTTDRTFIDALNNEKKLSGFKGKPLIVHFWETWCPPCLKEMPVLDRFQKKVIDEKLEIIAINRDSGGTYSTIEFYVKNQIRNLALYTDRMGLFAHEMKVGKVPGRSRKSVGKRIRIIKPNRNSAASKWRLQLSESSSNRMPSAK